MGFIIGSLIAGGIAAVSAIGSAISRNKQQKRALAQQKELNADQFQYNEAAADNALDRQLALNESQNYQNQVQDAKDAGLSVGLLYGGGGAGGAGGGRASSGSVSGSSAPEGDTEVLGAAALGLDAQRVKNEWELQKAEKEKIKAETEQIKEETASSIERSPIENELLSQQAISAYIDNIRKEFENTGEEVGYQGKYVDVFISNKGNFSKQQAADIAKAVSEADKNNAAAALDTEKKQGYWQELLNATRREDTEAAKAAAVKLAAEWSTGEYTNWKTWSELANQGVGAIKDIIGVVK